MPTFKSYVDKEGYYINARPSYVGNVTYQVTADAEEFLVGLGYGHKDDLPWGIVKPLRVAGLLPTKGGGVTGDEGDVPTLDPSKLPKLAKNERIELINYFKSRSDIPQKILDEILALIDDKPSDSSILAEAISEKLGKEALTSVEHSENGRTTTIKVVYNGSPVPSASGDQHVVLHRIEASSPSSTVDVWDVNHPYGGTWEGLTRVTEQKLAIVKAFDEVYDQLSFEFRPYDESTPV